MYARAYKKADKDIKDNSYQPIEKERIDGSRPSIDSRKTYETPAHAIESQ